MSNSSTIVIVALFAIVASTAAFNQGIDRAVITSVYPRYGSLAGGTLMTITGSGFQRGNISGSTDVYVGPLRCDINQYHSDDTTLVCKTRQDFRQDGSSANPMYYVKVARHSMTNVQYASCQTDCRFGYRSDRTPWITKSSATVTAGGQLMFGGYLRGLKALDYTIKIDNKLCSIREPYVYSDTEGNVIITTTERRNRRQLVSIGGEAGIDNPETFDASVGATSEEERVVLSAYYGFATEYCTLPEDLQAGLYNFTVNVRATSSSWGHGDAQFYQRLVLADFEGSQHVLTVAPEIAEVSTNVSGTNGGHTMVIKGTGFNPTNCENNIIHTQGSPCAVTWCNNTQIECTVGPSAKASTSAPYAGTMGLTRKVWNYRCNDLSDTTFNALPDVFVVDTSIGGATSTYVGNYFCEELTGFFVPQITSNYSFWVKGDDKAQVELDQNDGLGMRVLAYTPVRTTSYLTRPVQQKSDVFPLIAGQKYPIRARHSETTGAESMSIAVVAVDSVEDFEDTFQYHRIGEKQRISFSNSPRNQMQKIVFRNTSSGFVGIVKASDQNPYFIRVLPEGASTQFDANTFNARLRSMLNVHSGCSNVYVSSQLDSVAQILTIDLTYYCLPAVVDGEVVPFNTIRVDESRLESNSGEFIATSQVINVQTPTLPVQGTYTLSMGDVTTDPIIYDRYSTYTNGKRMTAALQLTFENVHGLSFVRSGNPQSSSYYDLSFQTPHGENYPAIVVNFTDLLGNALKVSVATIQNGDAGGRLFDPIPDLMLETARDNSAVTLETNGVKAICKDSGFVDDGMDDTNDVDACAFAYDDDVTPRVNKMRVRDKGDGVPFRDDTEVVQGGSIWLKGVNFKPTEDATVTVTFGGAACVFASEDDYTDTVIECSVQHTTMGTYYPEVIVSTTGKASFKASLGPLTYGFELDEVTPTKSSLRGGTRVTMSGTGFSLDGPTNKIDIGGAPCPVIETNFDYVVCIAPAYTPTDGSDISTFEDDGTDRNADITVGFFNDTVYKSQFAYVWGKTPILIGIEPSEWSSARTTTIVFFGKFNNKFTSSRNVTDDSIDTINCSATVQFVSPSGLIRECTQVQVYPKNVTCVLPRGEAFPVDEQAHVFPRVQLCAQLTSKLPIAVVAHPEPDYAEVDIALRMTNVYPSSGSSAGGTKVTITGAGFVNAEERIQRSAWTYNYDAPMTVVNVALADRTVPCQISSSNFTSIECTTVMPTSLQASLSAPVAHTYDEKGYNGFITTSINDFTVPGCTPEFANVSSTSTSYKFTPGKWCAVDDKFCFEWEHRDASDQDGIIRIKIEGDGTQYVALGFADKTNSMGPADVAMCIIGDDGKVEIQDRFSKTTGVEPDLDVAQGLFLESSSLVDGRLTCTFLRKITSTDLAQDRSLVPGGTNIIWSIKDVDETSESMYHKARGSAVVDDFFEVTTDTDSQFTFQAPPHQQYDDDRDAAVCNFDYVDTATPTLEQATPAEAAGSVLVTLSGTKFGSNPIVMVGSHNCPVQQTTITPTSIKCLVPKVAAGEYFFRVTVEGKGFAAHPDDGVISFRSKLVFESTSPRRSSSAGGLITTIAGKGFNPVPSQNEVYMNNRQAHVQFASTERLVVVTPTQTQAVLADVSIKVQTDEIPDYFFGQLTPAVTLYSDEDSAVGNLPASPPAFAEQCATENNICKCTGTVYYGKNSDWFKQTATDTIECSNTVFGDPLSGVQKECHCVKHGEVFVAPFGADVFELPAAYKVTAGSHCVDQTDEGANCKVDYASPSLSPAINSVVPSSGTKGTRIAIAGSKLAPDLSIDNVEVNIGGEACEVVEAASNDTHVICVVGATVAGSHPVYVTVGAFGTARNSATRMFTSLASIDSISVASGSFGGGTEIVVKGKGFSGGIDNRRRADNGWGGWFIWEDQDGIVVDDELGTKIELGATSCTVTKTVYDELTCVTEPLNSVDALLKYKHLEPATLEPESLSGASVAKLFDNDFGTSNGWTGVEASFDLGADKKALATRIRFYPYHQAAATMEGGTFYVSADNSFWKPLAWVRQVHQGWNHITLETENQLTWRYFKFQSADGRLAKITELVVLGYEVASSNTATMTIVTTKPMSHPSLGPMTTDHALLKSTATSTSFEFKEDATGTVSSITPRFGSSLGGTTVTIDGDNLPTSITNADILVNGEPCEVTKAATDGTGIECTTATRGHIQDMKPLGLVVRDLKAGMGNAISNMSTRFRYLDRWSDVTTWLNDEPPIDGDTVIIPEDQTLLLDMQPPKLFLLLVHGMMVFDRMDLNLDASYILVQGGHLEIGTEDEPFLNTTTITLHGDRLKSIELPFVGAKMLAVADKGGFTTAANGRGADVPLSQKGVFDCHGKPRVRTWTKVAVGTIEPGTKEIETAEPTDFAAGEIIVLTAPHQELTVDNRISPTKFTVVEEIEAQHLSEIRHHVGEGGDFELDMRCEVALLSRNIVIQGAGGPRADGSPTILEGDDEEASTAQLFGIHTGTFHGGHYRVENTELRHCGQAGVEGRYCMHFHVTDDNPAPYSYIKSNSIHHSFQRATTIHKTHHALVQNNVAYHVMGHTYFVEDGDEMYNTFDGNIGIFTRPSHMALKSDTGPATFWTAIPDNYWRNNIAVDSEDRGAWFELVHQGETLEFHNNSFHHNKGIGFRNYPNYSPPSPQYFTNNSYFKNGGNGVFYKKGGDNHHVFSKFAENGVDIFWTKYHTHDESRLIPNVHDCVFWGGRGAQAIFTPQHEFFYINGSTFIDYDDRGVLSGCAGCCKAQTPRQGGYTVRSERLHWINSNQRTAWTCPYKQIFLDLDGSLTDHKGGTALPYYKFNDWDACSRNESTFDDGMVCDGSVRVRRLQLSEHSPRELDRKAISFKKSSSSMINGVNNTKVEVDEFGTVNWKQFHESGNLYNGECYDGNGNNGNELDFSGCDESDYMDWITYRSINGEFHGWAVPIVTHADYHVDIDWHIDFQTMNMRWSEPFYFYESYNQPLSSEVTDTPESVMLRWPYIDYRYRYRVNYDGDFNNQAQIAWYDVNSNRSDLGLPETFSRMDAFGAGEIVRQDESLRTTACCGEWKVAMNPWEGITDVGQNAKNPLVIDVKALQCGPSMCGLPGDIPAVWPTPRYWSDPATWVYVASQRINTADITMTGNKPQAGESVEIPQGVYILMDEDPPALNKLVVSGKLKFDGNSRHVEADRILVWGIMEVGDAENKPFNGDASITLHGVRTSPTLVATDQHYLGNKNLVVFGQLRMFGKLHTNRWVALESTANKGDTAITVQGSVEDWKVGDKIVVAGTEYPEPVDIVTPTEFKMEDYKPHEQEEVTIKAIDGQTITLETALSYRHFAGVVDVGRGDGVELRAHVGLLTSNIVIKGDLTDTPVAGQKNWYAGYGGHIVVGEVNFGSQDQMEKMIEQGEKLDTVRKLGSLYLTGVELRDMGKLASEHPAVFFHYFSDLETEDYPKNKISNCAFSDAWNHAVSTRKSFGVEIEGNVMHKTWKNAVEIDVESKASSVVDNLVVANQRSPDDFDERCLKDKSCMNNQFAAFMIWNKHFTEVSGNVAANSEDTGFIMYPVDECGTATEDLRIHNNVAYGNLVGAFLMDTGVSDKCLTLTGFTSWKNAHLGIIAVDQSANLELKDVHVADNHQGISLNFVRKGIDNFARIVDSSVIGSSPASTCAASKECKAVGMSDVRGLGCNSEFGASWRRVGIVMPQYTNKKKTCDADSAGDLCDPPTTVVRICALPWENRFGNVDVQHAEFNFTSTSFAHWADNDCGMKSRAIAMNPSQPDFAPETFMADTTWHASTELAKVNMGDVSYMTHEATACDASCDAVNFFAIKDTDGTAFNMYKHWDNAQQGEQLTLHSDMNPAASHEEKCRQDNTTGAFFCRDYDLTRLVLESNPPRFTKRRIGPATIAKYGDDVSDNRTYWSVGPFPQGCSCQKHFAQFTFDVQSGQQHDIITKGILEARNRVTFASNDPNKCMLAKIFFSKPHPVKVTRALDDRSISPLKGIKPSLDNDNHVSGTNLLDPQERMLYIKLCGGENKQFWLEYENAVQVTASITMSYAQFFATDQTEREYTEQFVRNMALLLGIKQSQIKVVCVHKPGTPCTRGGGRQARQGQTDDSGLEIFFEITPTLSNIQDGTETSTSDEEQAAELEGLFDTIRTNRTQLLLRSALMTGEIDITDISMGAIATTTSTTATSVTSTLSSTTTGTSSTLTSSTATSTSSTTTGSRTTSTTTESYTSTTSITETTATKTSTTTATTVTQTTQTSSTMTTVTLTAPTTTIVVEQAGSASESSSTDQISVLAGVLACVAAVIVIVAILLVRRTKKLSSGGYAMGTYEEAALTTRTKPRRLSAEKENTDTMIGDFVESSAVLVEESAIDDAFVEEDNVEDGPGVFAFKASKFQDSLRVSKPSAVSVSQVKELDTDLNQDSSADNDAELMVVQTATPIPAFQMDSRVVGRTFNMEGETEDCDEADTEGIEAELPSQFFGNRHQAVDHTNLELNPAMFGARGSVRALVEAETTTINPITPDMLDGIDDLDLEPAEFSVGAVVDEYLSVDAVEMDDDDC